MSGRTSSKAEIYGSLRNMDLRSTCKFQESKLHDEEMQALNETLLRCWKIVINLVN